MKFEFYELNYNCNAHKVEMFNVFRNSRVNEWTLQAVKKYVRNPKKYKYVKQYKNDYLNREEIALYGFDAFCAEIRSILMNQCWSRREYEISVSDAFVCEIRDVVKDLDKFETLDELKEELIKIERKNPKMEKWDVFDQCEKNIPVIAREVIYQYKKQLKEEKESKNGNEE